MHRIRSYFAFLVLSWSGHLLSVEELLSGHCLDFILSNIQAAARGMLTTDQVIMGVRSKEFKGAYKLEE